MTYFPLTPIVQENVRDILDDSKRIHELVELFGSPLHLLFPQQAVTNLYHFTQVTKSHRVRTKVYYAHKANRSFSILQELARVPESHVDVASLGELRNALAAGFTGERIEATGPKNLEFLRLALLHNVLINVNSLDELYAIERLHTQLSIPRPVQLFLRIQQFPNQQLKVLQKDNKFGLPPEAIETALSHIKSTSYIFSLVGFSFHLTTTSSTERIIAIEECFRLTLRATALGLQPTGINIGGGFSINHLIHKEEWNTYIDALKNSLLDQSHISMSWNQSGLGYWAERGGIRGAAKFSNFYQPKSQFEELNEVLASDTPTYGNIGQFLNENMLTLFLEPGRSLLDQVGVTIGKVSTHNRSTSGELVVFMDMNRNHLHAIELEFMADPIHISYEKLPSEQTSPVGLFLSGNLCLPHDLLTRRKVFLNTLPKPGDLLAFVNTAGYFMDFNESATALQSTGTKLAYNGHNWFLDSTYQASIDIYDT